MRWWSLPLVSLLLDRDYRRDMRDLVYRMEKQSNFHLPRSTNLMLASAFAGREVLLEAYQEAIALKYRFYSFGDGMIIL